MVKTVFELVKIKVFGGISSMMSFMRGKNSNGKGLTLGTVFIIAVVTIAFLFMMAFSFGLAMVLGFQMSVKGCIWLYFPLGFAASIIFALLGSVFASQSYLFDANDNDLLLSMPIKPSAVLLSRMLSLFLLNCIYSYLIFVPVGLAYGIFFHFNVLTGFYFALSLIMLPAAATALSCIFGYLLSKVSAKIPNKNLLTVIFGFLMLGALVLLGFNLGPIVSLMMNHIEDVAASVKSSFGLLYWYGVAASTGNFLYLLPMLFISLAMPALMFVFLSRRFTKIITHKAVRKKKKYVEKPMKRTNLLWALIKKEVGYFLSIPSYVMNAGMSTIMSILLGVTLILKGDIMVEWLPRLFPDASGSLMALAIGSSLAMCCTMNDVTAPSISLEGKTLWILKSTPIKPMMVFVAKAVLAPIVSMPGIIFTSIISAVVLPLNSADVLFIIFTPILACLFSGFLGVCINLKLPRFDWSVEIAVIKQSLSVIVTLLAAMFFTAVPFVLAIIPAAYLEDFSAVWSYGLCIMYFVVIIGLEIFYLMTDGKKIYSSL